MTLRFVARRVLRGMGTGLVALYVLLDAVFGPLFRPIARLVRRVPLLAAMARAVATLPPYGALTALALPFILAEPAKILGLYLMGRGHWLAGAVMLAAAYLVSLVVVDRIFEAGRPALLRIGWFAALIFRLAGIRDRLLGWLRTNRLWRRGRALSLHLRRYFARPRKAI